MNDSPLIFISELLPEDDLYKIISEYHVGLELICFSISDNLDHMNRTKQEAKDMLSRLGNPAVTVHGPFLDLNPMAYDSKIRQVTMDRFKAARDGALAVGAKKIVYHSCMIPTVYYLEGWAERMIDFWNLFLKDHEGITVCMENVLDREIEPILKIAKEVDQPSFELCLDLAHAHCYSPHSVMEWAAILKDHIGHLHLHDNNADRDAHLALDAGTVPWREVLDLLCKDGKEISCTLECTSKQDAAVSISLLRNQLVSGGRFY